jgi:hypothetical protein
MEFLTTSYVQSSYKFLQYKTTFQLTAELKEWFHVRLFFRACYIFCTRVTGFIPRRHR